MIDLAIVIPAFDERENLAELIPTIHMVFAQAPELKGVQYTVIPVVEIGSTDRDFIDALGANSVVRSPSDDFGDAMRTGISTGCRVARNLIIMDADGSHAPATVQRLWNVHALRPEVDIVIASRYVSGGTTANSFPLRLMSRALNLAYSITLSLDVRDISTNFKFYRGEILREMELSSANFDIVEEILAKAAFSGRKLLIVEIPDHFGERKHGKSRRRLGPFIVTYLLTLIRLRVVAWRAQRLRSRGIRKPL